jgi:TP901 family phage tail tape measure protein
MATLGDFKFGVSIDDKELKSQFKNLQSTAKKQLKGTEGAVKDSTSKMETSFSRLKNSILSAGKAFGAFLILNKIKDLFVASIDAAIEFESTFAGIRKTVDGTEADFAKLSEGMRNLAKRIPVTVGELNKIGEIGGQLGVGIDSIEEFTETIARIAESTNLTVEAAATNFARFSNIMEVPISEVDNLASSVVALGNKFATTESEILTFSTRIAAAGKLAGLTSADVFAISTAFTSVGVQAEAGGTAVNIALKQINTAVIQGNEDLELFAATAGVTSEEFQKLWQQDAGGAFTKFIEGLDASGNDAVSILDQLFGKNERVQRAFLSAATAGDKLSQAMKIANEEFQKNIALTEESNKRFATNEARIQVLKNRWNDFGISVGSVTSALVTAAEQVTNFINDMVVTAKQLFNVVRLVGNALGTLFLGIVAVFVDLNDNFNRIVDNMITIAKRLLPAIQDALLGDTSGFDNMFDGLQEVTLQATEIITKEFSETNDQILKDFAETNKQMSQFQNNQAKVTEEVERKKREEYFKTNEELDRLLEGDPDTKVGKSFDRLDAKLQKSIGKFHDFSRESQGSLEELRQKNLETQQAIAEDNAKLISSYAALKDEINASIEAIEAQRDASFSNIDETIADRVIKQRELIKDIEEDIKAERSKDETDQEALNKLEERLKKEEEALKAFTEANTDLQDEILAAEEKARLTSFERFVNDQEEKRTRIQLETEEKIAELNKQLEAEKVNLDEKLAANRAANDEQQKLYIEQRRQIENTQLIMDIFTRSYIGNLDNITTTTEAKVAIIEEQLRRFQSAIERINSLEAGEGGRGFAEGGYTGDGGIFEAAGTVHKGEYVMPQHMVKAMPGLVSSLESMRTGSTPATSSNKYDNSKTIQVGDIHMKDSIDTNSFFNKLMWKMA